VVERAAKIEQLGYHSIWLTDHFWNRGVPEADVLECTSAMSALSVATEKLRIGSLVLCNSFRNPGLLAKVLATIDNLSNGRVEIGLGAGWMEEEYRAYGYEGVQILKLLMAEKRATFEGRYYKLNEAYCSPKPLQKPYPPITIGGSGEKLMLRIVAKHADRWNCPAGYRNFEHKFDVLKQHCQAVGRDISRINISEQLLVCIGANEAEVEEKWKISQRLPFWRTGIKGTPPQIIERLRERTDKGITFFTVIFGDMNSNQSIDLFAREVMPALA
jgi:alkanesulfonate monooxygenase SsuD/methylene tetrahydromethanopterin reductase-like flavin-dependent oxidoreductase (luciferase family)